MGICAPYYCQQTSTLLWIIIIPILAIIIPYILYYIYYPKYIKKKKEALIHQSLPYPYKRSEIYPLISPYFGDNNAYDFIIWIILDYADIMLNTKKYLDKFNNIKTYVHYVDTEKDEVTNKIILQHYCCFCSVILFFILPFGMIYFAVMAHITVSQNWSIICSDIYNNEWVTSVCNVHDDYLEVNQAQMMEICDPNTINITQYQFFFELPVKNWAGKGRFYFIQNSDLSITSIFDPLDWDGMDLFCLLMTCCLFPVWCCCLFCRCHHVKIFNAKLEFISVNDCDADTDYKLIGMDM